MKYFAYGSNMNLDKMKGRCPDATFIDKAILTEYRFMINNRGVATVIKDTSFKVYGILWEISNEDQEILDNYEGIHYDTYYKEFINVQNAKKEIIDALIYLATDVNIGSPRATYMEAIISSALDFGFPENYIKELKSWVKTDKQYL